MALTQSELAALPVGAEFTVTAPCPLCGLAKLTVKVILRANKLGTYSLAGVQTKVTARRGYQYHCSNCDAYGKADPDND